MLLEVIEKRGGNPLKWMSAVVTIDVRYRTSENASSLLLDYFQL